MGAIGQSLQADGKTADPANHEYDLQDFYDALKAGNFPAVSYIKLDAYQDGHAGYSDPLDEQAGTATLINFIEQQPDWQSTAIFITWDDFGRLVRPCLHPADACVVRCAGRSAQWRWQMRQRVRRRWASSGKPVNGRCGPGTRIPFLVISPWARPNHVDHARISLASVVRFIEDNWLKGERLGGGSFDATAGSVVGMFDFNARHHVAALYLDPDTGDVLKAPPR